MVRKTHAALQAILEAGDEIEQVYAAGQALEELDFYTSAQAAATPMFDESQADDDWDTAPDWNEEEDDDRLGQYE